MKIFYAGQRGGAFGWGVFGEQITKHLGQMGLLTDSCAEADVCVMPLADHDFAPASIHRAAINCAVCFFEYELGPNAVERAKTYDIVFAGSTWCLKRMRERGITNGQLLIQGVDHSIFYPRPRKPDGQFRIFSGGKFEYRKGQDLVIEAFREFSESHPEAHLVCSWYNPWPQLITNASRGGQMGAKFYWPRMWHNFADQQEFFGDLLFGNGVKEDRFTILPQLSHAELAEQMAQTDCGLFPNRCEGGTNLVLMEYAAMERDVIANAETGHADIAELISFTIKSDIDNRHWADQEELQILSNLRWAYDARNERKYWERKVPTWKQTAETVANAIARLSVAV